MTVTSGITQRVQGRIMMRSNSPMQSSTVDVHTEQVLPQTVYYSCKFLKTFFFFVLAEFLLRIFFLRNFLQCCTDHDIDSL